jgi:hypothetical protein
MDAKAFVPDWADCTDPSDMTRCFKFAWWKKKCVAKKRIDGEGEACRSRMIYKPQAGSKEMGQFNISDEIILLFRGTRSSSQYTLNPT